MATYNPQTTRPYDFDKEQVRIIKSGLDCLGWFEQKATDQLLIDSALKKLKEGEWKSRD